MRLAGRSASVHPRCDQQIDFSSCSLASTVPKQVQVHKATFAPGDDLLQCRFALQAPAEPKQPAAPGLEWKKICNQLGAHMLKALLAKQALFSRGGAAVAQQPQPAVGPDRDVPPCIERHSKAACQSQRTGGANEATTQLMLSSSAVSPQQQLRQAQGPTASQANLASSQPNDDNAEKHSGPGAGRRSSGAASDQPLTSEAAAVSSSTRSEPADAQMECLADLMADQDQLEVLPQQTCGKVGSCLWQRHFACVQLPQATFDIIDQCKYKAGANVKVVPL